LEGVGEEVTPMPVPVITKLIGLGLGLLLLATLVLASFPLEGGAPTPLLPTLAGPITITKTVQPEWINPRGYGTPDRATLTITVRGDPARVRGRLPLDLVFLVDRSATIDITQLRDAVTAVLELLDPQDQIGLVSFATTARTDLPLVPATEENRARLRRTVEEFINAGRTACDFGVAQATALLASQGRRGAIWAVLMLTDGTCTHGHEPETELAISVELGIAPLIVGVGMVSRTFPRKIEEVPGVKFFISPAFFLDYLERTLREIAGLAGKGLVLIERLPGYIRYEGRITDPSCRIEPDGGYFIECYRDRLGLGESWQVSFMISAEKTGELPLQDGELRMENLLTGSAMPPIPLPPATIRVKNVPPRCDFIYEPAKPTIADDVNFYDRSTDPFEGVIVSWEWDFGDGSTSSKRNPTHRYRRDGQYLVTLKVTDDEGATCETSRTITVGAIEALPVRSILTFPWEQVLPDRDYNVTIKIIPKVCINGLGLKETYPQGWEITPVEHPGAEFKPPNEWIWQGPICPDPDLDPELNPELLVRYEIAIPAGTSPGRYAISGAVSSFSPWFEIRVGGLTSLEVVEKLSIEVAIACFDVAADRPDPHSCYDEQGRAVITQEQIERAKEFYRKGEPVPGTGGALIDYEMMLRLLAYYQTGTPVTEPLPNPG